MTETASHPAVTGPGAQSATDGAKEKVQEAAGQVQQKAVEVKGQAGDRFRQELDARSTDAGEQFGITAQAIRRSGEQLRSEGNEAPAKMVTAVADRAERLGGYLTQANADQILRDVENFARRQPVLFAIGGATLGFLGSRFMKASSSRRFESSGSGGGAAPVPGDLGQLGQDAGVYAAGPSMSDDLAPTVFGSERGGGSGQPGQ